MKTMNIIVKAMCQCCDDTWHLVPLAIIVSCVLSAQVQHLFQSATEARQFVGDWLKMLDVIGDFVDYNYLDTLMDEN